ncbi:LexA family protein [Bacillus solitudinis]|uniref:LexA family protein n=1 Tax=Bacillus solitudinis TaxID=2014074 RepID=UPI000C23C89F|nr:LexA repressor [Bacillus solitudinis]
MQAQRKVLNCIQNYIDQYNYSPSSREIGELLNYKSSETIHGHFVQFFKKGLYRMGSYKTKNIKSFEGSVNLWIVF